VAVHALAKARFAGLGDEARLIILGDEVVEIVVGFEDDVAAASAVAAAGSALRTILFALESDAPLAAVACPSRSRQTTNEGDNVMRSEARILGDNQDAVHPGRGIGH